MIEAQLNQDQEKYNRIAEIRQRKFNNLMRIEADLVYYGHFTATDIAKMKVVERRFHINEINRRLKEAEEQRKKAQANKGKKSSGSRRGKRRR